MFGGDGDDSVFGGAGDDWVRGGQGNDLLDGEAGTDTCEGGRGKADEFVSCEEVLDRPAPSGWYWVRNLRAGFDRGIDIDPATGLLWGVDSSFLTGHIVGAQDHTGRRVVEYQVGGDEGLAVYPIAVQVFDGELYVLGRDSQRVVVMGTDGTLRRHWGGPGAAPGEFESPCDIVVTETQVIVSERSGRFQVFDHDGMYESEFTGATNACRFGHLNDELYVADFNRHKVFVYSVGGELQRRIGSGLLRYPRAIDTSPASGLVWVGGNHSDIYALTPSGDLVHTISGFETVMALTVDGSDHAVWTTHWVTCCHGEIRNRADVYTDLSCAGRRIEFIGTAYDDSMVLNGGNRIMHGGPGDDLIDAGNGDDYICGGQGADTLLGRSGDDFLFGQGGADKLRGGAGDDSCDGGQGDDELFGCEVAGVPR